MVALFVVSCLLAGTGLTVAGGTGGIPHASEAGGAPTASPSAPTAVHEPFATSPLGAERDRVLQRFAAAGLPRSQWLLPNFAYRSVKEGAALVPANLAQGVAPGPTSIGVNDLGLRVNASGGFVPYSYRTTSLDGTVAIDNLSLLPIENNASNSLTLQLNAILNNVTLFGQSIYQIWAQNVIFYSLDGDQLQLATDGWNFTGGNGLFQNDLYANSPGGYLFTGTYVHAVPSKPPAYIVHPPFSISFYLNATNVGGRNALYFNYTLSSAHDIVRGTHNYGKYIPDGSFDWIIFNSTAGQPAGYVAPPASFLISGSQASNIGLPNDAEMAICGGSDGFSSVIRALNGSARLQFLNGSTGAYQAVPAAFTTTEDTGESVEGVDAHFTAASARHGTALLSNGPEFIYGLWNATAAGITERPFGTKVSPASALLWVAPTSRRGSRAFNDSLAAWALAPGPNSTFYLPTGPGLAYAAGTFANDYARNFTALTPGTTTSVALATDPAAGLYVPILAFGNAQVAGLASSGNGSASNPYVIAYHQTQPILSLFGQFDIFTEPLYPGLLLDGITAHVTVRDLPSLAIRYTPAELFPLRYYWGLNLSSTNQLPVEIYDSSNVTLWHAQDISGWFPATLTGFLMASLFLCNDSHLLVADNLFESAGSAMVVVAPLGNATSEGNVITGNVFRVAPVATGPTGAALYKVYPFDVHYLGAPAIGGLGLFASGNTVYNNRFETPITAYSPPQNPYLSYVYINDFGGSSFASVRSVWTNAWNVSLAPATEIRSFNGFALSGSVVGARFEGGNAWSNWNGTVPYTDGGLLYRSADDLPTPVRGDGFYAALFQERGLAPGTRWTVQVAGSPYATRSPLLLVYEASGSYHFHVLRAGGKVPAPSGGSLRLDQDRVVTVRFR